MSTAKQADWTSLTSRNEDMKTIGLLGQVDLCRRLKNNSVNITRVVNSVTSQTIQCHLMVKEFESIVRHAVWHAVCIHCQTWPNAGFRPTWLSHWVVFALIALARRIQSTAQIYKTLNKECLVSKMKRHQSEKSGHVMLSVRYELSPNR